MSESLPTLPETTNLEPTDELLVNDGGNPRRVSFINLESSLSTNIPRLAAESNTFTGALTVGTDPNAQGVESAAQSRTDAAGHGFLEAPWIFTRGIEAIDERLAGATGIALGASATANGTAVASDEVAVYTSGAPAIFVDAQQRVGIGGITNPQSALDVAGNIRADGFEGNGSGLTALPAGQLTGSISDSLLSANIPRLDANNIFRDRLEIEAASTNPLSARNIGDNNPTYYFGSIGATPGSSAKWIALENYTTVNSNGEIDTFVNIGVRANNRTAGAEQSSYQISTFSDGVMDTRLQVNWDGHTIVYDKMSVDTGQSVGDGSLEVGGAVFVKSSVTPAYVINTTDASSNEHFWYFIGTASGDLSIQPRADDYSSSGDFITLTRIGKNLTGFGLKNNGNFETFFGVSSPSYFTRNVGFGGKTNPTQPIDVNGGALFTDTITIQKNGNSTIRLEDIDATAETESIIGAVEFYGNDAQNQGPGVKAAIRGIAEDANGASYLSFTTSDNTSNDTEVIRLSSTGQLLLNGATPLLKAGFIEIDSFITNAGIHTGSSDGMLRFCGGANPLNDGANFSFGGSGSGSPRQNEFLFRINTTGIFRIDDAGLHVLNDRNLEVAGDVKLDRLRENPHTVASAPTDGQAGDLIYVSDGDSGSPCFAGHDGSNWRRIALGAVISAS